jgi:DNA-binding MarR family transcriptional regulator
MPVPSNHASPIAFHLHRGTKPLIVQPKTLADFYDRETLGAPENAVGFMLWRTMHRFQRAVDRELAPLDLTHLQFTTLAMVGWLGRTGIPVKQADLARHADIQAMQISLMLRALEAKGFVARTASASDTRAKRVEITRAGLDGLRAAMPVVIGIQRRMFGKAGGPKGALLAELRRVEDKAR